MISLLGEYSYRDVTAKEFDMYFQQYRPVVFRKTFAFNTEQALSQEEREAAGRLGEKCGDAFVLRLGIFREDEFVGWHLGRQEDAQRFYMVNTGILEAHRNRGLYRALLPVVLKRVEAAGFQIVYSRHTVINNQVIVPKLKAGFIISGMEVDDRFGTSVQLSYYFNPIRRKMMDVRAGQTRLDEGLEPFLE